MDDMRLRPSYKVLGVGKNQASVVVAIPASIARKLHIRRGSTLCAVLEGDTIYYRLPTPDILNRDDVRILRVHYHAKNTLRVTIPCEFAEKLGIRKGDEVKIKPLPNGFTVRKI